MEGIDDEKGAYANSTPTAVPTCEQRVAYKRLQVLAEMNESIYTLTRIEAVLDQINQSIVSMEDNTDSVVPNKRSVVVQTSTLSDKMNQLLIELQKWDDDF